MKAKTRLNEKVTPLKALLQSGEVAANLLNTRSYACSDNLVQLE
jgi:hypothetical protein